MSIEYGQFCPIAKANEILGEKWTILVVRELLMGGSRFNELQRGLPLISPTLLSKRLDSLVAQGLVHRRKIAGQRGHEYHPTRACRDLLPLVVAMGEWGMKYARSNLTERDYDVGLLMLYLRRSIVPENLPASETVIKFHFDDVEECADWWIVSGDREVELCIADPGKPVDVYFASTVRTLAEIWMGNSGYRKACREGSLKIVGDRYLVDHVGEWIRYSDFAGLRPATEILEPVN